MAVALNEGLLKTLGQETSSAVLAQNLKALSALLGATPYHRLPSGLLTSIVQASFCSQALGSKGRVMQEAGAGKMHATHVSSFHPVLTNVSASQCSWIGCP